MKLKILLPLILVLCGYYATETEAFAFGVLFRVIQRFFRCAAEMARRGNHIPYRQLTSSSQAVVTRSGQTGARHMIKNGLSRIKNVVASPKFQAGLLAAEAGGAIIDAAVESNRVEKSYANYTDAELEKEWEVSYF